MNQTSKDSWWTMPKQTIMLSELFIILGMPLSKWLTKIVHVCSIQLNCLISIPNNWSNLSYKINTRPSTSSTKSLKEVDTGYAIVHCWWLSSIVKLNMGSWIW
jgi:hypothetical protein